VEAIATTGSSAAVPASSAGDATRALVVLPFENVSTDPENEFFADGLTEEIISDLSKIGGLRVISRTSSMQLKGRKGNLPALVRELNVQFVLEGSVRKAGDRLRITAQLIDAIADAHLWSEKYNGTMEDVFDIQERVARAIASELRVKLTPEESREIAERPIADPAVYEHYLRARAAVVSFTTEGFERARKEIEQGLKLAPDNILLLSVHAELEWQSHRTRRNRTGSEDWSRRSAVRCRNRIDACGVRSMPIRPIRWPRVVSFSSPRCWDR
jgi:TolB-like protein